MSGPTPGRWIADGCDIITADSPRMHIVYVASGDASISIEQDEANARLIAAAPELLGALKALRDASKDAYKTGRVDALAFVTAGNVIAKAEGK